MSKRTLRTRISSTTDQWVSETSHVSTRRTCRILQNGSSDAFSDGLLCNRTRSLWSTKYTGRLKEKISESVATTVQRTPPLKSAIFSLSCSHFLFSRVVDRCKRHRIDYTLWQVDKIFDYRLDAVTLNLMIRSNHGLTAFFKTGLGFRLVERGYTNHTNDGAELSIGIRARLVNENKLPSVKLIVIRNRFSIKNRKVVVF